MLQIGQALNQQFQTAAVLHMAGHEEIDKTFLGSSGKNGSVSCGSGTKGSRA
jgi:hypothetical protein